MHFLINVLIPKIQFEAVIYFKSQCIESKFNDNCIFKATDLSESKLTKCKLDMVTLLQAYQIKTHLITAFILIHNGAIWI